MLQQIKKATAIRCMHNSPHLHHRGDEDYMKSSSSNPSSLLRPSPFISSFHPRSCSSFSLRLSLTVRSSSFFAFSASRLFPARCFDRYASLVAGSSSAEPVVRVFSRRFMVALMRAATIAFFVLARRKEVSVSSKVLVRGERRHALPFSDRGTKLDR